MRTIGYALLVVATTAFLIAASVVAAIYGSTDDPWGIVFASLGAAALIVGPLMTYAVLGFWNVHRSDSANARYRRYRLFAIAATVVGAILLIVWVWIAGAPWWVAGLFIVIGAGLLGGVLAFGPLLQRNLARLPPSADRAWETTTRQELGRVGRGSLISGTIALVVATAAAVILLVATNSVSDWPIGALGVAYVTVLAATVPVFTGTIRASRGIREALDGDMGLARKFARVILKNKPGDLTERERTMAARWASLVWLVLLGQLLIQVPTFLMLGVLAVPGPLLGGPSPLRSVFAVVLLAMVLFFVAYAIPVQLRYVRRARRYAAEHADLISSPL